MVRLIKYGGHILVADSSVIFGVLSTTSNLSTGYHDELYPDDFIQVNSKKIGIKGNEFKVLTLKGEHNINLFTSVNTIPKLLTSKN